MGERPLNLDNSNIVWLGATDMKWIQYQNLESAQKGAEVAFLWGETQKGHLNGTLIKLPAGFKGKIKSKEGSFRGIIIKGMLSHQIPDREEVSSLDPGSYFSSKGSATHMVKTEDNEESIIYVRTDGKYEIVLGE